MKNHAVKRGPQFLLPRFLAAVLATFWAVGQASAAEVRLNRISENVVEIAGESGRGSWRIRYGLTSPKVWPFKPQFAAAAGNRAWYAYGSWLRLIDTEKGVVLGRWHFPAEIVNFTPEGTKIRVEIQDQNWQQKFPREAELDPSAPHVPYWPPSDFRLYRVPLLEANLLWPSVIRGGFPRGQKVSAEEAQKLLPELEEAVRRDPLTPWFRIGLAKALKDIGDPRAAEVAKEAIDAPTADYTELLAISVDLDSDGDYDLGRAAFERGYQDFWQKGNDPRLFIALITRLVIFGSRAVDWETPETPHSREFIERSYKLMPYGEGAPFAWRLYANYLAAHGATNEAQLWRARAEDAAQGTRFTWFGAGWPDFLEVPLLVAIAALVAAILFAVVTDERYRPQRRLDLAAQRRATGMSRLSGKTQYWPRKDRSAFFSTVFVAWFSVGLAAQYESRIVRIWAMPVSAGSGSFTGPVTIAYLQSRLSPTPERDLLLAFAYQQDGQAEKAAQLYRHLPQFAESWNNLGVILREAGKDQEARAAFEKALAVDPRMAEAALNLGRPPADFWTEQHQKYLPGRPMIALPTAPHVRRALLGRSLITIWVRSLAGPFAGEEGPVSTFEIIGKLI